MFFCKTFLIFLGMVAHLREWSNEMLTVALKRNLMARRRHCFFGHNTELVCDQTMSSTFRWTLSEMRDHTQENQKSFAKESVFEKFFLLELSGGKNVFGNELTQES